MSMANFLQRLRECVADKGVSDTEARRELGRLTGMGRANLSHWFSGRTKEPKGANVIVAAQYFGVEPLWFAKGEGPKRFNRRSTEEAPPVVALPVRDALEIALAWQELPERERAAVRRLLLDLRAQHREHESRTRDQWEVLLDDIRANNRKFAESLHDERTEDDAAGVGDSDDRARATQGAGHPPNLQSPARRGGDRKRARKKAAK